MDRYTKKIGLAPGSLVHIGKKRSVKTKITVFNCQMGEQKEVQSIDDLKKIKNSHELHWINITGLHETIKIEQIGKLYDLHVLVLEDILHTNQRPKVQSFDEYLFIVLKMLKTHGKKNKIESDQFSIILGKNVVITFEESHTPKLQP